ncbi:MAG: anti-sigma factor [Balneolaceae bacterium]
MENNENEQNFEELCAAYVLGSLSKEENESFKRLLENADSEQQQLFEDMEAIASEMALLYPEVEPTASIKKQLIEMAWASVNAKNGGNFHYLSRFKYAVAASVVFMIVSIGLLIQTQNLNQDLSTQVALVTEKQSIIEALESEVMQKEELLTILEARDVDLILMDGLEVNPNGYGKVVWDKDNGQALLQVANIPQVPTAKEYQLWFVVNNQPISAGVFAVNDPNRDNFFKISEFQQDGSGAFAITLEPEGGSPQPTGDMYLLGNM